ncbi:hypothetical protein ABZ890_39515 [Streptomyces sp. NPDC046984]|uniref:hypothetical protein n=1 Tax=Streptomyces sp. NPDC046984 TaxID=3155138 RepID=UPI0034095314
MKVTSRDEWRVVAELTPCTPADLGLPGLSELADSVTVSGRVMVAILPRRLGDLGGVFISDRLASSDIEGGYRRRCEEIATQVKGLGHVSEVHVTCTETHTCSHCGCGWEVLSADEAADPACQQDEHSVEGEPVCCEKAIVEFRAERGIPALAKGGVA